MVVSCNHTLDVVSCYDCKFINLGKHYIHSDMGRKRRFRLIAYFMVAHKAIANVNGIEV